MKKLLPMLLLAALLAGCAAAPAETTAPSTTAAPATKPTTAPTTVPTTVATQPPTTAPTEPVVEDHDTYFSHVAATIVIETKDGYTMDRLPFEVPWYVDYVRPEHIESGEFEAGTEDCPYYFDKKTKTATLMFPEPTGYPVGDGERFMAVTKDGTKLVMMYPGGEYEVLRESPDGRLQDGDFLDQCVYFLDAVDEEHDGIYRLYLPDGTVDLMLDDLPRARRDGKFVYGAVGSISVISNVEVQYCIADWNSEQDLLDYWTIPCLDLDGETVTPQAFYAAKNGGNYVSYDQYMKDCQTEDCTWYSYGNALHNALFRSRGKYDQHYVYRNFLTDITRVADSYNVNFCGGEFVFFYPNGEKRSRDMEARNDFCWWLDPYYTK